MKFQGLEKCCNFFNDNIDNDDDENNNDDHNILSIFFYLRVRWSKFEFAIAHVQFFFFFKFRSMKVQLFRGYEFKVQLFHTCTVLKNMES